MVWEFAFSNRSSDGSNGVVAVVNLVFFESTVARNLYPKITVARVIFIPVYAPASNRWRRVLCVRGCVVKHVVLSRLDVKPVRASKRSEWDQAWRSRRWVASGASSGCWRTWRRLTSRKLAVLAWSCIQICQAHIRHCAACADHVKPCTNPLVRVYGPERAPSAL